MSTFKFSQRSEKNLSGIHPHLERVVRRALQISTVDFGITEGLRTRERQTLLVEAGKSQTMNSRHITGHAVDVFAYPTPAGSWDMKYYRQIAEAFKQASEELNIATEWGGNWTTLKDGPHFQLRAKDYP
jgi:peptidoglycan L-alanyl-D-glutamate endopeptidase CwlK